MIGFYVSAKEGYISFSAIFYLMFLGFHTVPLPGSKGGASSDNVGTLSRPNGVLGP